MSRKLRKMVQGTQSEATSKPHQANMSVAKIFELPLSIPLICFRYEQSSENAVLAPEDFYCVEVNSFLSSSTALVTCNLVGKTLAEICPDSCLNAFILKELEISSEFFSELKIKANNHILLFEARFCRLNGEKGSYDFIGALNPTINPEDVKETPDYWVSPRSVNRIGKLLSDMLGKLPYPVYFRDLFGKYHYVNKAFLNMCIKDRDFVTSHLAKDILSPAYYQKMIASDAELLALPTDMDCLENEVTIPIGESEKHFLVVKSLLPRGDGIASGISGFMVDISRLKELQLDLAEAKASILERYMFFRQLADSIPAPCYYSDVNGKIISHNKAFAQSFVPDDKNVVGLGIDEVLPSELAEHLLALDKQQLAQPAPVDFKAKVSFDDKSSSRIYHFFRDVFKHGDDNLGVVISIAFDITKQTELEDALRRSEERWQLVTQATNEGIFDWNIKADELFVSDRMLEILRLPKSHCSLTFNELMSLIDKGDVASLNIFKSLSLGNYPGNRFEREFKVTRPDNTACWVACNALQVRDHEGTLGRIVGSISDISERKGHEEQIIYRATHDSLTGLLNRVIYLDYLHQAIAQSKRDNTTLAVVYLDMNNFKEINDTFGHDVGDDYLRAVAERLKGQARDLDNVARMGGDEFSLFLRSVQSAEMAKTVLERHAKAISAPVEINGQTLCPSGSFGFSVFPQHGHEVDLLIKKADAAMYYAKRNRQPGSSPVVMWDETLMSDNNS